MLFKNKKNILEVLILFIGIILSCLMFKTLMIHTDNTQLMDKVVKIKETGQWTHHGNATTKMGALPGSFLTFVTAVPMLVWYSPYAACAVILLFHIISYFLLRSLCFKYNKDFDPLILAIFYWLNPWRVEQSELYNPGYLFLFSSLHFYCLYNMSFRKNFWDSFLLVLATGFCFQVHFSVLILGFSFLYLYIRSQIKVHYMGFIAGLAVIALTLVPWFLDYMHGGSDSLKTQSDAYIGKNLVLVYPVLKAAIYFLRMASVYCGRHIFSEITFDWITNQSFNFLVSRFFYVFKWIMAFLSMYCSFTFFKDKFIFFKRNYFKDLNFFDHYLIATAIGVLGSSALSPVEFNHWHLVLAFPIIIFYVISEPQNYFTQLYRISSYFTNLWMNKKNQVLTFTAIVFILWNIFASLGSRSHNFKNDYERDFELHYNISS